MRYEKEGAALKKYAIDLDITKCISCGACSVACMDQNDFQVKEGQRPFRNVFDLEMEQKGNVKYSHLSLACMHCSDAPCISACPRACLKKTQKRILQFMIPPTVLAATAARWHVLMVFLLLAKMAR